MIRIIIAFLLIFGALPAQPQTQSWGDITWVTEEFPPWSYTENGEVKGFYIDLLEAIWVELGVDKTRDVIQVLPWARGMYYLEHRPGTALFSIAKSKSREKLGFQWVGPVKANNRLVLTVKQDSPITISTINDVNELFGKQSLDLSNK